MKKKIIKCIISFSLAIAIVFSTALSDCPNAYGMGYVAAGSAWEAITGSGIAYAGYKATKKQTKEISDILGNMVGDFITKSENTVFPDTVTKSGWTSWVSDMWKGTKYYQAYKAFSDVIWAVHVKKSAGSDAASREDVKETTEDLKAAVQAINNEKKPDGDDNNPFINILKVGAGEALKFAIAQGFEAALSHAVDAIIKEEYNAEYEKSKSKYDWGALGFKADYTTFNQMSYDSAKGFFSSISDSEFEYYSDKVGFSYSTGILLPNCKDNYSNVIIIPPRPDGEKTSMVTIRNPDTGKWFTSIVSEKELFNQFTNYKNGLCTLSDFIAFAYSSRSVEKLFVFGAEPSYTSPFWTEVPAGSIFNGRYSSSPFPISNYQSPSSLLGTVDLQSSNCRIVNQGKTMDYFYINFANETTYAASCSALSGTIQPAIPSSDYTNFADEVNKAGSITINIDKASGAADTDELARQIAESNDLILKVKELVEDGNETSKGILAAINALPGKIYDYFSGILNRILKAVKANPLAMYNYLKDPLSSISDGIKGIAALIPQSVTAQIPGLDDVITSLNRFELDLDTIALKLIAIAGTGSVLTPAGILNDILEAVKAVSGGSSLADVIEAIESIPPVKLIEELPDNVTYMDIVNAVLSLPDIYAAMVNFFNDFDLNFDIGDITANFSAAFETSIEAVFKPGDTYFQSKADEINLKLKLKLPYDVYLDFINNLEDIEPTHVNNVTIDLFGSTVTIINFDYYYEHMDEFTPWFKGVFFFLLHVYNVRHLYFLVRGSHVISPESDIPESTSLTLRE